MIATDRDLLMNNDNSNIDVFIENLPNEISLSAEVEINPLGNVTDGNDFIYTAQPLQATLDIDLPLNIGAQNLIFTDTLDIASELNFSANGELMLYVTNAFPFETTLRVAILNNYDEEQVAKLFHKSLKKEIQPLAYFK